MLVLLVTHFLQNKCLFGIATLCQLIATYENHISHVEVVGQAELKSPLNIGHVQAIESNMGGTTLVVPLFSQALIKSQYTLFV